jgi:4-amino-4-deoxy-L-arabinose transferase-like glycosyltransferase
MEAVPAPDNPRSLSGWLPFLWSRVLFPGGAAEGTTKLRPWSLLGLIVLPGVLIYPSLSYRLLEPDEGRYAEIPREMLARADWVVPYLNSEPYLDKPPLLYWCVMASYRVLGVHDWSARLIPALAVHGCILLVYLVGRRLLGERAAFWGSLLLSLAPGFTSMGRLLVLDGLLAFWVTASIFSAFEAVRGGRLRWGWWLAAGLCCGFGVLTKGPIALVLLAPPIWLHAWLTGQRGVVRWRAWLALIAVAVIVALPWYVAVCIRMPGFVKYFLWEHNVVRFVSGFDHLQPVWYYAPILLGGLLPASLLLPAFARFFFKSTDDATRAAVPRELGFTLLAGGWCIFFFTLSGCKLPTYILPAYPTLCLALGWFLASRSWRNAWWVRSTGALAFLILMIGHHLALPWYATYRSPMRQPEVLERFCSDPSEVVVCHPRPCDSVAFYLGRDDLHDFRSKEMHLLIPSLLERRRTVLLFTHRHSLKGFKDSLPPNLHVVEEVHCGLTAIPGVPDRWAKHAQDGMGETALGLCDIAVVVRTDWPR